MTNEPNTLPGLASLMLNEFRYTEKDECYRLKRYGSYPKWIEKILSNCALELDEIHSALDIYSKEQDDAAAMERIADEQQPDPYYDSLLDWLKADTMHRAPAVDEVLEEIAPKSIMEAVGLAQQGWRRDIYLNVLRGLQARLEEIEEESPDA